MTSMMQRDALDAASCVALQMASDASLYQALGRTLRAGSWSSVLTLARGSSDHAASYCAHLIMTQLGRVVASLPPSLLTLYQAPLASETTLAIAVSQSGQSPDLVQALRYFRVGKGSLSIALVNHSSSPLAQAAQWVLPLHAGVEHSVCATKSFITSLVAGARLVAHWQNPGKLQSQADALLARLPEALLAAAQVDWSAAIDVLAPASACKMMVVGRGASLPLAQEAALKLKECCHLQAEALSGAEILHGPVALIEAGYPLLIFATRGPAQASLLALARNMRQRGARVLLAAPCDVIERDLDLPTGPSFQLDAITAVQAFYMMAARLAQERGCDPDHPRHLSKVTRTY